MTEVLTNSLYPSLAVPAKESDLIVVGVAILAVVTVASIYFIPKAPRKKKPTLTAGPDGGFSGG
jgi:hypothetical protein